MSKNGTVLIIENILKQGDFEKKNQYQYYLTLYLLHICDIMCTSYSPDVRNPTLQKISINCIGAID